MDVTVLTAIVSPVSALLGAVVGFAGARRVAERNRQSDRQRRSVDRLVDGLDRVETAYRDYRSAVRDGDDESAVAAQLAAARRFFDRATELFAHSIIRSHSQAYGRELEKFFLYGDQELDALDAAQGIVVPTEDSLRSQQRSLLGELRRYESK